MSFLKGTLSGLSKATTSSRNEEASPGSFLARIRPTDVHDTAALNVLVIEVYNDEWNEACAKGGNPATKHIAHQGALLNTRTQWLKAIITIENSACQIYGKSNLHSSYHCAVARAELPAFTEIIDNTKDCERKSLRHVHVSRHESVLPYTKAEWKKCKDKKKKWMHNPELGLYVINEGTPQWTERIEEIVTSLQLEKGCDYAQEEEGNERGNYACNYGFTGTGKRRDMSPICLPKPQYMAPKNKEAAAAGPEMFASMSDLTRYLCDRHPGIAELHKLKGDILAQEPQRQEFFAKTIHPRNIHDALTLGINCIFYLASLCMPLMNAMQFALLIGHLDNHNDSRPGKNMQTNVNGLFACTDVTRKLGSLYRIFCTVYEKKDCGEYMDRYKHTEPLCKFFKNVVGHMRASDEYSWKLDKLKCASKYREQLIQSKKAGHHYIHVPRMVIKGVQYDNITWFIMKVDDTFGLHLWQILELCYNQVGPLTPLTYFYVYKMWCDNKELPKGSLIKAFFDAAKKVPGHNGCVNGGKRGKLYTRAPFAHPVVLAVIEEGLRQILNQIPTWNAWKVYPRNASVFFAKICWFLQERLPNYGPLQAQELGQLLVRLTVVRHPILALQGYVCTGTKTHSRIRKLLKKKLGKTMSDDEIKQVLDNWWQTDQTYRTISSFTGQSHNDIEHEGCKYGIQWQLGENFLCNRDWTVEEEDEDLLADTDLSVIQDDDDDPPPPPLSPPIPRKARAKGQKKSSAESGHITPSSSPPIPSKAKAGAKGGKKKPSTTDVQEDSTLFGIR